MYQYRGTFFSVYQPVTNHYHHHHPFNSHYAAST